LRMRLFAIVENGWLNWGMSILMIGRLWLSSFWKWISQSR
jgi:hypothetical protein